VVQNGWHAKVNVDKMDVMVGRMRPERICRYGIPQNLPFPDSHFYFAFANFLYMLIPKPVDALRGRDACILSSC
jgi:hypothetical protein